MSELVYSNHIEQRDEKPLAIIMAGGSSRRFATLGQILPKGLFAVSESQTLLSRIFDQLYASQSFDIVLSTSPKLEQILQAFVNLYLARLAAEQFASAARIKIFANRQHALGPVPALAEAIKRNRRKAYLLCLSDICFIKNPFEYSTDVPTNVLFVNTHSDVCGGVVLVHQSCVLRLSYNAVEETGEDALMFNWTGAATMSDATASDLLKHPALEKLETFEDGLNWLIGRGHTFGIRHVGTFINVNSFTDLVRCQREGLPTESITSPFGGGRK